MRSQQNNQSHIINTIKWHKQVCTKVARITSRMSTGKENCNSGAYTTSALSKVIPQNKVLCENNTVPQNGSKACLSSRNGMNVPQTSFYNQSRRINPFTKSRGTLAFLPSPNPIYDLTSEQTRSSQSAQPPTIHKQQTKE